jgi:ubiquinone/menaquinone biosynthesis C-methylase UbiE
MFNSRRDIAENDLFLTMTTATPSQPPASPSSREQPYVLGTGSDEAFRLGLQHRLWSNSAFDLWIRAGLQPGMRALDLGCGPGHASLDIAQIVGAQGRVVGVDESAGFLKQLGQESEARKLHNIDRVLGDAQKLDHCLPSPATDDYFDVAYTRWVFCFVSSPDEMVKGIRRVLRPGGKLLVQDYFNYEFGITLAPRRECFSKAIKAVGQSWRSRGGNPDIMGELPRLLKRHGFEIEHMDVKQRIARPNTSMWHWPWTFFNSYLPKLVESGFLSQADCDGALKEMAEVINDDGAFMLLPPVFEVIAVKS